MSLRNIGVDFEGVLIVIVGLSEFALLRENHSEIGMYLMVVGSQSAGPLVIQH